MKKLFKKKSLGLRHTQKEAKKYVEIGKAPLISVSITVADGAKIETSGASIKLLCDAVGENNAVEWHSKYMDKFNALTKKCYSDLEDLVKEAKAENADTWREKDCTDKKNS